MKKVLYKGELHIGNMKIPCYVLENGKRVISALATTVALKMVDENTEKPSGTRMARYMAQKSLNPFFIKTKGGGHIEPIECIDGNRKINGYDANLLADICEAFLEARRNITLSPRQAIIADQCEVLMRAFARVGIIALVDEATGYQHDREKDELQKILNAYIAPELLPWQKRFPDSFYKHLFRLNKWEYSVRGIQKRPSVIGKWTNTIIYNELPKGVMEELKKRTPVSISGNKTARYHQYLTMDIGEPHLEKQIVKVITLFEISDNMRDFWSHFTMMKERQAGQLSLPFEFDKDGHTKE